MTKIILDAMGGDNAPAAPVEGACIALERNKDLEIVLTGRKADIEEELKKHKYDASRLEIVDCPDVIDMNEIPTEAVRKRESSMMKAYYMLKGSDEYAGFVTAGSTGACIAGGQLVLGRIKGVKRAALCSGIPNVRGGVTLLCDCGANAECRPAMLCQFAILATAYAKGTLGIENPKVGLLNNGTEEHKGDTLRQETYKLMQSLSGINFVGNIEGRDIMMGDADIAVADGFSGNIALKSMEGCGKLVLGVMRKEFSANLRSKMGYLMSKKAVNNMRDELDFEKVGGAPLLGLKKIVVKSHGSSKAETMARAVENAANAYKGDLVGSMTAMMADVKWEEMDL